MADVRPFRALHYDPTACDPADVTAPPYDVIDDAGARGAARPLSVQRRRARPAADRRTADIYEHAAELLGDVASATAILVDDAEPTIWALEQDYTAPDGGRRTRRGFLARIAVTDYGDGLIRPHERTQPGPKEDRLRLTRATGAQPLPDLRPPLRRRLAAASRRPSAASPFCEIDRRRRHRPPRLADRRPRGPRRPSPSVARRLRAADRRRPPPLRDRPHLRRRGRRRRGRRRPLHARLPRLARGPGPERLRDPPPAPRPRRRPPASRSATPLMRALRARAGRRRPPTSSRPPTTARSPSATWTPSTASPTGCGSRTTRSLDATRCPTRSEAYRTPRRRRARSADPQGAARHEHRRHRRQARPLLLLRASTRPSRRSSAGEADAALLPPPDPGRAGPRRRRRRRDDAAEVDLLLPEAPDRDRLQPALPRKRRPGEDLHAQGRRRHHRPLVRRPRAEVRRRAPRPTATIDEADSALGVARARCAEDERGRGRRRPPRPPARPVRRRRRARHRARGRRPARGRRQPRHRRRWSTRSSRPSTATWTRSTCRRSS